MSYTKDKQHKGFAPQPTEETQETERVQYQGKTSEGYSQFTGQLSAQQIFELANSLSRNDADQVNQARKVLTTKYIEQYAGFELWKDVSEGLQGGLATQSQVNADFMQIIEGHFETKELDKDFFTKSLNGSSSTPLLKAVA